MALPASASASPTTLTHLPLWYRLFFLSIEPLSTIVGFYYAYFAQHTYLSLTHDASAPRTASAIPTSTSIVLAQLANLYLLFAFNEAVVLRSTNDPRVWRTLLLGLLVADVGHLWSVRPLGVEIYWEFWRWNAIDWGNIGFVYVGAATRVAFLAGLGLEKRRKTEETKRR